MAGIGLINLDLQGKAVEPVAVLAVAGVAGFFLFRYLNKRSNAGVVSTQTPPVYQTSAAELIAALSQQIGGQPSNLQGVSQTATSGTQTAAQPELFRTELAGGTASASNSASLGGSTANSV